MKKLTYVGAGFVVALAGAASAVPPVDTNIGAAATDGFYRAWDNTLAATQIRWYRFVTPGCNAADSTYIDIDNNANPTIAGTAIFDTELGLYTAAGDLVGADDDAGTDNRAQLSFGAGSRAAPGNGIAFNGQNGPSVAAGEYYLAVGAFNTNFAATGFGVTGFSNATGTYRVEMRSGRMPSATPPVTSADLGNLRGLNSEGTTAALATSGSTVHWVKFHLDFATSATGYYCDLHTIGSSLPGSFSNQDSVIALFDAAGAPVTGGLSDDYGFGNTNGSNLSGLSFGRTAGPRNYTVGTITLNNFAGQAGAALAAGDYYVGLCRYSYQTPAAGFVFGSTGAEPGGTLKLTVATNMPPVADYDMGIIKTLNSPASTPDLTLAAGQVRWITFRTEVATSAATFYCDLNTLGSQFSDGSHDTELGLYAADGTLIGSNDDRQFVGESSLSYGLTAPARNYPAPIGGAIGADGAVLPAGLYYASVAAFNIEHLPNFRSNVFGIRTGTVRLNVSTNMGPALDQDLGLLNRTTSPLISSQFPVAAGQVKWIHFRTGHPTGAGTYFVDIHSLGSVLNTNLPPTSTAPNDTEIGLYTATGVLVASNDDRNAFGESALTYGLTSPARAYPAPINNLAGNNGAVLPAGDYYVSVSAFNTDFSGDFGAVCTSASTGVVRISLFSNLPVPACNAADVAGLGGSAGSDGALTADDIIVYLDAFFANNLAVADIAVLGGTPGSDGVLTADDLIYFLAQFFAPCNPS